MNLIYKFEFKIWHYINTSDSLQLFVLQDMKLNKQLEFIWRSHRSLPENQTSIFTHVLDSHYSEPHILGLDVEERARFLADICYQRGKYFATPHLLLPFGSDFTFINATEEFEPMDDYIQYINSHEVCCFLLA